MTDIRDVVEALPAIPIDHRHRRAGGRRGSHGGGAARRRLERHRLVVGAARGADDGAGRRSSSPRGRHLDRGSHRVLVQGGDRLVVTVGLSDVIIVDTPDALLVCPSDRAEEIKQVLDEISAHRRPVSLADADPPGAGALQEDRVRFACVARLGAAPWPGTSDFVAATCRVHVGPRSPRSSASSPSGTSPTWRPRSPRWKLRDDKHISQLQHPRRSAAR